MQHPWMKPLAIPKQQQKVQSFHNMGNVTIPAFCFHFVSKQSHHRNLNAIPSDLFIHIHVKHVMQQKCYSFSSAMEVVDKYSLLRKHTCFFPCVFLNSSHANQNKTFSSLNSFFKNS